MTEEEIKTVALAIFGARNVISIPRLGMESAPFDLVWQCDETREELKRQARGAIKALDEARGKVTLVEAMRFAVETSRTIRPHITASADGEVSLQWIGDGRRAIATLKGDGTFDYAMLVNGSFRGGAVDRPTLGEVPRDLREYLVAEPKP